MLARRGVDAHDPQPAEISLLAAPADEGIFQRGVDRFFRGTIQLALVGVVSFREAKQLLAFGPANCSSFHPRHSSLPRCQLRASSFELPVIPHPCPRSGGRAGGNPAAASTEWCASDCLPAAVSFRESPRRPARRTAAREYGVRFPGAPSRGRGKKSWP